MAETQTLESSCLAYQGGQQRAAQVEVTRRIEAKTLEWGAQAPEEMV